MYQCIMVPLDGSRFAETALPLATRLSQRAGSRLHLVMIAEPSGPTSKDCEAYLKTVADRLAQDYPGDVTRAVKVGNIVEKLVEEREESGGDATVMATHGRGGLSRMWLGSIATGFLHHTRKPLVLVRPEPGDGSEPVVHWGFAKLLVPLDGTERSERVLAHAIEFGRTFAAKYHLVRVVIPPVDVATPYAPPSVDVTTALLDTARQTAAQYLEECAAPLREHGLTVTTSVGIDTQAGRGILQAVEEHACDSIAMATHGRVGLSRAFLGSAADKVLRGAHVPLLLYRPESISAAVPGA